MGTFSESVFAQVATIPRGKVSTYGQIARLIGSPRSARYVGYALRNNPSPGANAGSIPCHRVVFKDGSLCSGFIFGGPDEQRRVQTGRAALAGNCIFGSNVTGYAFFKRGNKTAGGGDPFGFHCFGDIL